MNFDEWYAINYVAIMGTPSPLASLVKEMLRQAWNAAWKNGYDQGKNDPPADESERE